MNPKLASDALFKIANALYELAEAFDQPAVSPPAGEAVAGRATSPAAADFYEEGEDDGLEPLPQRAPVAVADQGSEAVCPKHKTPFIPSKFAGKPAYCPQKSDEPGWSRNGFCAITAKSAIVWIRKHAAVPA